MACLKLFKARSEIPSYAWVLYLELWRFTFTVGFAR